MSLAAPKVSIGLPVFNGEQFLDESLSSVVGQTFGDLEIIVVDNASTDNTPDIIQRYARLDGRIKAVRNPENIGISGNWNRAFRLARGQYFKWMAHDDICEPTFIERCVDVLDSCERTVIAYPRALEIDSKGGVIGPRDVGLRFDSGTPVQRFRDQMIQGHAALALYGLIRARILGATALHPAYPGGDRVLLAELALHGPFIELEEYLFLHRDHGSRETYRDRSRTAAASSYRPGRPNLIFMPAWSMLGGYLGASFRAPINMGEKLRCAVHMLGWIKGKRGELSRDIAANVDHGVRRIRGAMRE